MEYVQILKANPHKVSNIETGLFIILKFVQKNGIFGQAWSFDQLLKITGHCLQHDCTGAVLQLLKARPPSMTSECMISVEKLGPPFSSNFIMTKRKQNRKKI